MVDEYLTPRCGTCCLRSDEQVDACSRGTAKVCVNVEFAADWQEGRFGVGEYDKIA